MPAEQVNDQKQITIQSKSFQVPIRYKAGYTLKENEAAILNHALHESLRNNFSSKVKAGVEAGTSDEDLQQQLDDYAERYQFGPQGGGGSHRGDPAMLLAMNIARDLVRQAIRSKGLNQDEWPATRVSQFAKALLERQGDDGAIVTTARKQLETEKEAHKSLSEVGNILDSAGQAGAVT
jgi:hypothetical protein